MGKVFISYRHKDVDFAHRLAEKLEERLTGAIFIDRKITEDDFERALLRQVHECNVFVLVVTENTFAKERIHGDNDWVRREIALALELQKPITLAMRGGKTPPQPSELPENIRRVTVKQGIPFHHTYFDESADNLAQHCVTIANGALKLRAREPEQVQSSGSVSNVSHGGDSSVQLPGATISDSTVEISTGASKRQEAIAAIQMLREEEKKLQRQINRLSYEEPNNVTAEGVVAYVAIALMLLGIGFAIHPIMGIIVIVVTMFWFGARTDANSQQRSEAVRQVKQLKGNLREIRQRINSYQQIID